MFGISFSELLVVAVIALLVLGPQRMPQAVRTLGLYVGRIRRMVTNLQQEVNNELQLEEMRQRLAEHEKKVMSGLYDVEQTLDQQVRAVETEVKPVAPEEKETAPGASRQEQKHV